MAQIFDPDGFQRMLAAQVQKQVAVSLRKIADKACDDLRAEVMSKADALALKILSEYNVSMASDRVIITVRKQAT